MCFRSLVNVDEARIDAGSPKYEVGAPNRMKKSSSFERRASLRASIPKSEHRTL
jgi:hypothetical protein